MQPVDQIVESLAPGLVVGLTTMRGTEDLIENADGDDTIKFLFQLEGESSFNAGDAPELRAHDLTTAIAVHGRGVNKVCYTPAGQSFSVVIVCEPSVLINRFGVEPRRLPKPIASFIDEPSPEVFWEAGRMSPQMAAAVRAMRDAKHEGIMRRVYLEARAMELVCDLCSEVAQHTIDPLPTRLDSRTVSQVERVREQIDRHFAQPLSISALARSVGTNATRLGSAFRDVFGMTVFEYVRLRRMEEGKRLLRQSERSVTEIAFDVGYEHPCNFAVAFKRHYGLTPREERTRHGH
jgi:AraC-like DNA-binding protein